MSRDNSTVRELPPVMFTNVVVNELQVANDDPTKQPLSMVQIDVEGGTEQGEFSQSFQMPLAIWLAVKEKLR